MARILVTSWWTRRCFRPWLSWIFVVLDRLVLRLQSELSADRLHRAVARSYPIGISKIWGIGGLSKFLASLAVIFACFLSWALSARYFEQKRLVDNAKEFALAYFGLLQEGNLDAAYRLSTSQYTALYANDETSKTAPAAAYESVENNGDEKSAFRIAGWYSSLFEAWQASQMDLCGRFFFTR